MLVKMESNNSGGSVVSYTPDTSNLIYTINQTSQSWTATEDCVMVGTIAANSGWAAQIFLNTSTEDTNKYNFVGSPNSGTVYIGDNVNYLTGAFIAKGTKILTRSYGVYNLNFYKPLY